MKKFSAGGNAKYDAKYKRKIEDIKSDYDKAMKGKTGRAAEVAKAKYDQRMADAKDDLAKWTKADRTETRAAEKSAERNLSMTRKFGATKSAVKADDVAKVGPMDDLLKSAPKPQMPSKPGAKSRPAPTRRAPATRQATPVTKQDEKPPVAQGSGRMGDQGFAYKSKARLGGTGAPSTARMGDQGFAYKSKARTGGAGKPNAQRDWRSVRGGSNSGASQNTLEELAKRDAQKNWRSVRGGSNSGAAKSEVNKAGGGTVKKKPTPPQPTPEERAAAKRQNESLKKVKPTPADAGAIARGNRSSGMKKGGAVKKYAAGGITKIMPTANEMGNLGMKKGGKVKKGMMAKAGRAMTKKSADTMGRAMVKKAGGGKCYAKGGSVSSRADGIARKGKTNCKSC